MADEYPTEKDVRQALLDRADKFRQLTGVSLSEIGKSAVNDPAFLSQCANGRNFTIAIYQRAMTWLDEKWPPVTPVRESAREQEPATP